MTSVLIRKKKRRRHKGEGNVKTKAERLKRCFFKLRNASDCRQSPEGRREAGNRLSLKAFRRKQ